MTEEEIRSLVRDAVARHLGAASAPASARAEVPTSVDGANPVPLWRSHASFGKFLVPNGTALDGPCLIEPAVHCNHCGYCQSYGH